MFENFMGSNMDLSTILFNFITYNLWEAVIIYTVLTMVIFRRIKNWLN